MRLTRADKSVLSDWWFTVDRLMFFGLLLLMGAGLVLSLAASPPIAAKYHLEAFYFVRRQAALLLPAIAIMFSASTLTPKQIRRASLVIFVVGIALMALILGLGPEIKGAKRWLQIGFLTIQPSEFVKPAFIVLTAWLFNESQKRRDIPGIQLAVALYAIFAVLLILQPDFGQTLLVTLVWGALFYMAGINMVWIGALGLAGVGGVVTAYLLVPHVASRIDRFFDPASGDTYQTDRSIDSFLHGGWFGTGPWRGHREERAARLAHRFHLRGNRRRIRADRLPHPGHSVRLHRAARSLESLAGTRRFHSPCHSRPHHAVRPSGAHQHGGECRVAPRQGHDAAVHFLWRLLAARHGPDHGLFARAHPQTPDGGAPQAGRRCAVRRRNRPRQGAGGVSGRPILLAAGGTGGHLFPAAALAQELKRRGYEVELATDIRAEKYGVEFPARAIHRIPSATLASRNPFAVAMTFSQLGIGFFGARRLLKQIAPHAVIGFGGYPTLPPIIAASSLKIPTAIHEQNAVMGRANRLLSRFVDRIALSFKPTKLLRPDAESKARVTGTPVRDAVLAYREVPYQPPEPGQRLLLLIFGGSQGARFFSEAMPPALSLLPAEMRERLTVVQQAREEDLDELREAYRKAGIAAHVAPFFRDLPERIAKAHLVVARSGASTVAELMAIGRPCLLVPLPHALDNDQLENATRLQQGGGGWCVRQQELSRERLAQELERLLSSPDVLAAAAANGKAMSETQAVSKLADLAEELARLKA